MSLFEWLVVILLALIVLSVSSVFILLRRFNDNFVRFAQEQVRSIQLLDRIGSYANESSVNLSEIRIVSVNQFEHAFPAAELRRGGF